MILTIERLGQQGDGVSKGPDASTIFVAGALPGETVEGEVKQGRMPTPRILGPSPDRVRAACPHYRACGGCSVMHASDRFVANWKTEVLRGALLAQGLDAPVRPIVTSPERSRRRATFAGRRIKSGAVAGFHGRASGAVVDVQECRLLLPVLVGLLPVLRHIVVLGASRQATLDMTATATDSGIDLAVSGGKPLDSGLFSALAAVAADAGIARLTWEGETVIAARLPMVRFGKADVRLPPGAFLQATAAGEAALLDAVREAIGPASRIADLFSGCGTFALPLAEHAAVHAVEGDAAQTQAMQDGWRRAEGLRPLTCETRDLFRRPLLAEELARFDAVVLDPPRAGAEAQVAEIARSGLRRVAYVSCNPATFARDARVLVAAGFRIDWVQVVDQFRWSGHVELAACMSR